MSDTTNDKRVLAVLGVAVVAAGGWWIWQMGSAEPPAATSPAVAVTAHALADRDLPGLSDLAERPGGGRVAVAERNRALVLLDGTPVTVSATVPLLGVPDDVDIEALTFLDRQRAVLGTERHTDQRDDDALLLATEVTAASGVKWQVQTGHKIPYRLWNLQASSNHGVEGLCALPGAATVLAAVEHVEQRGAARLAPLGVLDWNAGRWTPYWLQLTSKDGKPSALWCEVQPDGAVQLWLIERHYGTSRIVRAVLPPGLAAGATLQLSVWLDLAGNLSFLPNWEGLIRVDDQTVELLSDNASGEVVRGPGYFLRLQRTTAP